MFEILFSIVIKYYFHKIRCIIRNFEIIFKFKNDFSHQVRAFIEYFLFYILVNSLKVGSFHRLSHSRLLENALFFFFRCYIDHLCSEINEQLTEVGALSISYLVKNWNLPFDLLNDHIFAKVGCKINATRDFDILYTQNYLSAQKNLIRAVVNALTKFVYLSLF